jgi:hypothetical protein
LTANTTRWQLESSNFSFCPAINFLSGFNPMSGMEGDLMNPTLKPWIRWLLNEEATGLLKKEYDVAIKRAGRVFNIFRIMSLRPSAMQASMQLYVSFMQRSSEMLGRPEREMIAVVVSQTNHCPY